tara:strand:+ start:5819 stop:6142 length:324 start_codon:yes stop_codon:yes gene_type:complete
MLVSSLNDLLTTNEVCNKLKIKRTTFDNMKKNVDFPTPFRITGGKGYRYSEQEILQWLQSRKSSIKKIAPSIKQRAISGQLSSNKAKSDSEKKIILRLQRGTLHGAA